MSALIFLATGFEEIEAITVIDVLRRAEIEVVIAGLTMNPIIASRQTRHLAEVHVADIAPAREFEIVILPGGVDGAKNLAASPQVREWIFRQRERGAWVGAICAAPTALLAHGFLDSDTELICHPSVQAQFSEKQVEKKARVVVKNKLITSLAAGSAMEFAFEIIRRLRGLEAADKVNQGVCALFPS